MNFWFLGGIFVLSLGIRALLKQTGWTITGLAEVDRGRFGEERLPWHLGDFLLCFLLAALGESIVLFFLPAGELSVYEEMQYLLDQSPGVLLLAHALSLGLVAAYLFGLRRAPPKVMGLDAVSRSTLASAGQIWAASMFVAMVVYFSMETLVASTAWTWEDLEPGLEASDPLFHAPMMLFVAMAMILGPAIEEFLFRGILYPVLSRGAGVAMGTLLTAFIFSMLHLDQGLYGFLNRFLLGIFLAYAMEQTGSVLVPWLVHGLYNGGQYGFQWTLERLFG